ncbi:hypothetical protein Tco_0711223 [Tanacetum coccineum]
MASSCCSSNVTPTPVLDEIIAFSGETEISNVMKIFFKQQIAEEEAFTKYILDKIVDVKASLTRWVRDSDTEKGDEDFFEQQIAVGEGGFTKISFVIKIDDVKLDLTWIGVLRFFDPSRVDENFNGVKVLKSFTFCYNGLVVNKIRCDGF